MATKPTLCILALRMQAKITPDRVLADTIDLLDESKLSDYAIGYLWAETSDTSAASLMRRLGRWRQDGVPKSIEHWVELMDALGCDVEVTRRQASTKQAGKD